jgi:aminoglycoside phosphotransferase family enzyme/predicted kinase
MIIVVFGLPGSGKSYLAQHLSRMLHAVYITSDAVRKELFMHPSYSEKEKKMVYDEMLKRIAESEFHKEVVVDATLSDIRIRQEFISKVKDIAPVYFIEVTADEVLIKQRLSNSRNNSDADFEVYEKTKSTWQPFAEPHLVLHSKNDNITEMLEAISDYIFSREMNRENILQLIGQRNFPVETQKADLIETHISWVIVCDEFVYKIKKPVKYSFLDYSTLTKRKYFCEKEVELNKRLTTGIYLHVTPVRKSLFKYYIDGAVGEIIDYAVTMRKLPEDRRMDTLLLQNKVSTTDIKNLAAKISAFHHSANVINEENHSSLKELFNDLLTQQNYLQQYDNCALLINEAVKASNNFFQVNDDLFKSRVSNHFIRDCHGDLHSRNIFLLPEPVPFDCLEFNDELRYIDVLNEIAFLCMDLDSFERYDLSALFFNEYNRLFRVVNTEADHNLFVFYKAYRANIRAKVNSFRAQDAGNENERSQALKNVHKYLLLMNSYLSRIVKLVA